MDETKTFKIDPRMFISSPFIVCPYCGKNDFGILIINEINYVRRCRGCWKSDSFPLPDIKKKVIYLDQFVISEMMKSINGKLGKKDKVDKTFFNMFQELDSLTKLQLIICPESEFHRLESLPSFYESLKKMYEHLACDTRFYDKSTVERFQLCEDFKALLKGKDFDFNSLDVDDMLSGDRNKWLGRFRISVDSKTPQKEIDLFQKDLLGIHGDVKILFDGWTKQKNRSFKSFFDDFVSEFGPLIAREYSRSIMKFFQISMGVIDYTDNDLVSIARGKESLIVTSLLHYLSDDDSDNNYQHNLKKVYDYMRSERVKKLPFNEIGSLIWAAIAYQAATGGRQNPPNMGMMNDIEMVSSLLPYCDAIFVDRDMHSLLNFGSVKKIVKRYNTLIFSPANKDDFFKYLEKIKKSATKKHIQIVKEVYGEAWGKPYTEMYDN